MPALPVRIRPATEADLPQLLSIHNHAILTTTAVYDLEAVDLAERKAWFDEHIQEGQPILAACPLDNEGEVLGYAAYGTFNKKAGYRHTVEHSVYVREGEKGRGVGTKLLAALLDAADKNGVHSIVAHIDADNTGSLKLHDRFGFTRVGTLHQAGRKFDRWLDVVMVQRLAPKP